MKRKLWIVLLLVLCLLLSGCSLESRLVGQWESGGTLEVRGTQTPFDYAIRLEFREDGTGSVTTSGGVTAFEYRATDDTLTMDFEEISHGVGASVKGDRLTINGTAFTRVK